MKTYQNYTIFTFILGILVLFASYFTSVFALLPIIGLIYAISIAYCLGELLFDCQEIIEKIILGFMAEVFVAIIIGSVFFYFYKLNNLFFVFITFGFPMLIFFWESKNSNKYANEKCPKPYYDVLNNPISEKSDFQIGNRISMHSDKEGYGVTQRPKANLSFFIVVFAIIAAIFSDIYNINILLFIIYTFFGLLIFILFLNKLPNDKKLTANNCNCDKKQNLTFLVLVCAYLTLTATLFYILIYNSTLLPMRTPWEALPKYFFVIFFIDTLSLIAILLKKNRAKNINYKLILLSIYLFLFFSIAYFIYKLGYGFDPFIHRATLDIILKTGAIAPKPFYYIGEYSLIFYLSKLIGADANVCEKILVPLLSAVFLPTVLYYYLIKKSKSCEADNFNWLIILSLFLIPFNFLIFTTPQNLANLFLVILIIFTLKSFPAAESSLRNSNETTKKLNIILILNALAIFFIHPISGIPACMFLILFLLWRKIILDNPQKILNTIYGKLFLALACLGLMSFPLLWTANSAISPQTSITINLEILNGFALYLQNLKLLAFGNNGQFKIILNTIYFFYFNLPIILAAVFIFSLKKIEKKIKKYIPYLASFFIFFLNYFILKIFFNFNFLINYERNNYTNRVIEIAYLFLIPFFLIFINDFWQKIKLKKFKAQYFLTIVLSIGLCASLYLTYPRNDNFAANHGYSTSKYDIMAVDYIDKNSKENFIVLANQQVSAAALQQFGFKKYYDTSYGKLFYYPIPTGNALYQYYLEMVNKKPTKEIMENAMKLVGAKEGYFVVNKYWWESGRIIDLAKLAADEYAVIGNGDVYIFKFKIKK